MHHRARRWLRGSWRGPCSRTSRRRAAAFQEIAPAATGSANARWCGRAAHRRIEISVGEQHLRERFVLVCPTRLADPPQMIEALDMRSVHSPLSREPRRLGLEEVAHLIEVAHPAQREGRDDGAALRRLLDEALLHQARQGRTYGRHAESVATAELPLGGFLAGAQLEGENIETDELVRALVERHWPSPRRLCSCVSGPHFRARDGHDFPPDRSWSQF